MPAKPPPSMTGFGSADCKNSRSALLREFLCLPASAIVTPLMIRNGGPPRRATGRKERPMPANLMAVLCPIRGIDIVPVPPIQLFLQEWRQTPVFRTVNGRCAAPLPQPRHHSNGNRFILLRSSLPPAGRRGFFSSTAGVFPPILPEAFRIARNHKTALDTTDIYESGLP
jgi:hypothetical protein